MKLDELAKLFEQGIFPQANSLVAAIDLAVEATQEPPRNYLGASSIGEECHRALWYSFRHATKVQNEGRMMRLWNRGHREEPTFVYLLSLIGIKCEEIDPKTGEQYRFIGYKGHFAGSCDGIATVLATGARFLLEFKTYSDKRFKILQDSGVKSTAPKYYAQIQVYMKNFGLTKCLFVAVNKNDDQLYIEWVDYDEATAEENLLKAQKIIDAEKHPVRISPSASWKACKFCDHKLTCHYGKAMEKSCRTCRFAQPIDNGAWLCKHWNKNIPTEAQAKGCGQYKPVLD